VARIDTAQIVDHAAADRGVSAAQAV